MARPRLTPTPEQTAEIERLAGRGFRLDDIAIALDISTSTLKKWKDLPEVDRAYRRGRIATTSEVAGKLYDLAMAGEVAACIFWLKSQGGWQEKPQPEATAQAEVVIYLPENNR